MRINSKEILFGQPILKIREVVRHAINEKLWGNSKLEAIDKVAKILKQPSSVAKVLVQQMIQEEYLTFNKIKFNDIIYYKLLDTEKSYPLATTRANPPIKREKATRLLNELIERARAINKDSELLYFVESLKVFGSYLSDHDILGDLDVGFKLARKHDGETYMQLNMARIRQAKINGRRFNNYVEEIFWSRTEVIRMLKAKQKGLSLHDEDEDEVLKITETKQVYFFKEDIADSKESNLIQE